MFFRKKHKGPQKKYIAYINKMAKYRLVMSHFAEESGRQLLLYFFDQTRKEIQQMAAALNISIKEPGENTDEDDLILCNVNKLSDFQFKGLNRVVIMEVHPLLSKNRLIEEHFANQNKLDLEFHVGLDEATLAPFGMDKIISLMQRLGMEENEPIEHSLVSKSLENGLEKLEKNLAYHQDITSSQEDWLRANPL